MLTKEQKRQWVEALRSGRYKQGKNRLKYKNQHGTRYCCLGVAQELFGLRPTKTNKMIAGDQMNMDVQNELASLNDEGYSFESIASNIENMPLSDFQP